ncbi:hypothetical protein GAY29_02370 [Azospirillum brasilense]|nr:hypothetical protein [Azospirillum brasilense]
MQTRVRDGTLRSVTPAAAGPSRLPAGSGGGPDRGGAETRTGSFDRGSFGGGRLGGGRSGGRRERHGSNGLRRSQIRKNCERPGASHSEKTLDSLGTMNMMHSRRKQMEKSQYKYLVILIAKTAIVVVAIAIAGYLIFGYNSDVRPLENKPMVVPLLR